MMLKKELLIKMLLKMGNFSQYCFVIAVCTCTPTSLLSFCLSVQFIHRVRVHVLCLPLWLTDCLSVYRHVIPSGYLSSIVTSPPPPHESAHKTTTIRTAILQFIKPVLLIFNSRMSNRLNPHTPVVRSAELIRFANETTIYSPAVNSFH